MSVGRADFSAGSRGILRAVIIVAAIVIVVLTMAPMARASEPVGVDWPAPRRPASDIPVSESALGSVRPDHECFTRYQQQNRIPKPDSLPAAGDSSARTVPAATERPALAGYGPCGKRNSFDPYGLGSLIWRGPDWGDPSLGHRT